ncbi:GNAT family N-acetyltransferase [Streptomyces sp. AV19]|uniref:GNAT family N-acetyltransferase n=1 Tax=Streptomyces sp. AV19 TaxID=2793068 RepID=UPI0018FED918|nr:GNAT family N-acetyltransferase [Streptomyces sp. AV19]MBH1937172.1 GNAT family N-acetyltransferase [Streptomyces sp. AV19]MDG4534648.1 GNAT family N-acetyltransferase [Streptomyces sp. AV19]
MSTAIRTIDATELADWILGVRTGFHVSAPATKEEVEARRDGTDLSRTQGAFDAGRCVGTFRSFAQRITLPGGTAVPVSAVTNVSVSATHRRRGLLSRMMERDLRAARERGETAATLTAAEYPIYGRFGFGPAVSVATWEVDTARTGLDRRRGTPDDGGRLDFVDGATVRELAPALHERVRATRHGVVDRDERWWRFATGDLPRADWTEPFHVLHRSPDGSVDGLLTYTVDETWAAMRPQNTASVRDLVAATPAAERALWHFLLTADWVMKVNTGPRAPDDILPLLLPDPRAARITSQADSVWLRPLDVPALLEARTYAVPGSLVVEVADPDGYAAGRWLLDAAEDGASCVPTSRAAELSLSAGDLGCLLLGDESAGRLAALGRATEDRPGAAARADALLRTSRRPWCPDVF